MQLFLAQNHNAGQTIFKRRFLHLAKHVALLVCYQKSLSVDSRGALSTESERVSSPVSFMPFCYILGLT